MVAGVCGGLADLTGIDPVIFRVIVAVATIMGGAGLVAYAIAWLVIPEAQDGPSHAESFLHDRRLPRIGLLGIGLVALIIAGSIRSWGWGHDWGGGGFGLIVVVGIGLWLWSREQPGQPRPPVPPRPAAAPPAPPTPAPRPLVAGAGGGAVEEDVTTPFPPVPPVPPAPPAPRPPRRRRERSKLVAITLSVAFMVAGLLVIAGVSATSVLASCLIVVGAGLVVGSLFGRRRGLIALGILLTLATATASVADVPFDRGAGDRFWHPTSLGTLQRTYELGAGDADLDLRDVPLEGRTRHVTVRLGAGDLRIWLPSGQRAEIRAHAGIGEVVVLGAVDHGVDVDRTATVGPSGGGTIVLDARVGFGHLEVNR
jgi:phage shock protein PspC (stress-responsive transcriptional regulator)